MRFALSLLSAVLLTFACSDWSSPVQSTPSSSTTTTAPPTAQPIRVLMLTATAGFRHDSIPAAMAAVAAIASRAGDIVVTATENLADVSATRLGATDVLMFALTSGELPFDDTQSARSWSCQQRGGYGFHAPRTLSTSGRITRLVGAYFKEHPWVQQAPVASISIAHPTTSGPFVV